MQVQDLLVEPGRQVRHQHRRELGVLGEAQHLVALGEDRLENLLQPHDLAGAVADGGAVVQQLCRVVAHLLELGHRGEDVAAPRDAVAALDAFEHVVDDRAVERRLLAGEPVVLGDLDLLRQVVDDAGVGLHASQQVGADDAAQQGGGLVVAVALDGDGEALPEAFGAAEHAGVEEVHDRPQLGQPVLHRGAGERDAVPGAQPADSA